MGNCLPKYTTCLQEGCNNVTFNHYCYFHKCTMCDDSKDNCNIHKCIVTDCNESCFSRYYCKKHSCRKGGCEKVIANSNRDLCRDHICAEAGCVEIKKPYVDRCDKHNCHTTNYDYCKQVWIRCGAAALSSSNYCETDRCKMQGCNNERYRTIIRTKHADFPMCYSWEEYSRSSVRLSYEYCNVHLCQHYKCNQCIDKGSKRYCRRHR